MTATDKPPEERTEEEQQELERQLAELLQELRVAMPGVQVLFGFLLTVSFQQRFQSVSDFQQGVYLVTLISAACATAFLIAPSAFHRVAFRAGQRPRVVRWGTIQFVAGLLCLALAMNGAMLLVTDVLFEGPTVLLVVLPLATLFVTLWFLVGLVQRIRA